MRNFRDPPLTLLGLVCAVLSGCGPLSVDRVDDQGLRVLHPFPQTRPGRSVQNRSWDGKTTYVTAARGLFPSQDPFLEPPGSNFLLNVNTNVFDSFGEELPNTLPSTPEVPYNLHDGEVITSEISKASPTTDLRALFAKIAAAAEAGRVEHATIQRAIDIIEGNPIAGKVYSGLPLLHYNGAEKVKKVEPVFDSNGRKIGGNVDVRQIWYDSHIESDTSFVDPSEVFDLPWTITYTIDVLDRARDDFSPFVMYLDDPYFSMQGAPPKPLVAMDQTFFPMEEGTRNIFKIKMSKGKYYNLTYHWGWRVHPPRVQVIENARKKINGLTLPQWESKIFGSAPSSSESAKLAAIAKIGDLAPAKRMWNALRRAKIATTGQSVLAEMQTVESAFSDWSDRTKLPHGVEPDTDVDLTLFYVNNTIYGQMDDYGQMQHGREDSHLTKWRSGPALFKVTLLNGDHFVHSYMNVDFGGSRGWENQFQSTQAEGGSGGWFTFGRVHWWVNAGGPHGLINIPPIEGDTVGRHRVELKLNFDPSRRLRLYQFDPLHHDVAVYSIH